MPLRTTKANPPAAVRPRRVGLAVAGADPSEANGPYSYGSIRTAAALALMLQRLPEVEACYLILDLPTNGDFGLVAERVFPSDLFGLPTVSATGGLTEIDTVIEVDAGAMGQQNAEAFKMRGGTLVSYVWRNIAADSFAHLSVGSPGDLPLTGGLYDAVWLAEPLWETCQAFARYTRSQNIVSTPYLWSPQPLLAMLNAEKISPFWHPAPKKALRVGILDANDRAGSTFQLPLLAAENAHRLDDDAIASVLLFGSLRLKEWYHLSQMLLVSDVAKAGKVFAEDEHRLRTVIGVHIDMVVTHQWPDTPTDLILDLLFLGWPVAHNIRSLSDAGYFYTPFDLADGGRAILTACREHRGRIDDYRREAQAALTRVSIDNPDNVRAMSMAMSALKPTRR